MCCFSGRVDKVSDTHIFARASRDGKQFLVYSMFLAAKADLAMVLPIPTPPKSADNAVRFISLKDYADFFTDMHNGFPRPIVKSKSRSKKDAAPASKPLPVVQVGSFEASFVPTVKDFARLDARFRLPADAWDALPAYKEYGFAVFKLKAGEKTIHPMAFEFPRADAKRLFFPTVHIHDNRVHKTASFDHALYCQTSGQDVRRWTESPRLAGNFMKINKSAGILDRDAHVHRLVLRGRRTNQDTWLV